MDFRAYQRDTCHKFTASYHTATGVILALNHHTGLELSPLLSSHLRVPSKLDNATADAPTWMTAYLKACLLRKEVIQPHLPIRLPCYDFTPIIAPTLDGYLLAVNPPASGVNDFRGVTGGVYKARERIHRSMLTCDY